MVGRGEVQNESNLIKNLRNGDLQAFDKLFSEYGDKLYGFALRYLKSEADAEELVQDVYVKIWENKKKIKEGSSFRSYLFTIAYNDICKIFRKRNYHNIYINEVSSSVDNTSYLDEKMDYSSLLEQVDLLIDKLPPKRKRILNMRHKEGKSSKDIAKELDISPGTVDNNISEAIKFVRNNLNENSLSILLFIYLFIQ